MPRISPPEGGLPPRRRLGIYGGTFDPPHIGHLIIASEIRQALGLDAVLFVPAGVPPHKDPAAVTPAADRLAMLQLAVAGNPTFAIDTIELDRAGPSFTADTLAAVHGRELGAQLWFIMGADSLNDLHTWRNPERIVSLARLAVAVRSGHRVELNQVLGRTPTARDRIDVIDTPLIEIASRELRERIAAGRTLDYLVPNAVVRYITERSLYEAVDGQSSR